MQAKYKPPFTQCAAYSTRIDPAYIMEGVSVWQVSTARRTFSTRGMARIVWRGHISAEHPLFVLHLHPGQHVLCDFWLVPLIRHTTIVLLLVFGFVPFCLFNIIFKLAGKFYYQAHDRSKSFQEHRVVIT